MLTSTPAGSTPDASPAASLIINADAAAFAALAPDIRKRASAWSVATTKTYYGFNCRPRQVRSIACIRDAERIAAHLASKAPDATAARPVAFGYLCRLNAALAKAEAAVAATRADYDACDARRMAATDRELRDLLRGKCAALWRRHDAADDRARDIRKARDIVAEALVATAQEGGAL